MASLGWTPGAVSGVIDVGVRVRRRRGAHRASDGGRDTQSVTETALLDAQVTASHGDRRRRDRSVAYASVAFVPNGDTRFRLRRCPLGAAIHAVSVDVSLEASP